MTAKSLAYLKSRFENGDIPSATDYEDVFDSFAPILGSAAVTLESPLTVPSLNAVSVSASQFFLGGNFSVNATGTTQATGKLADAGVMWFKSADDSNRATRLVSAQPGFNQYIVNATVTALRIYPCVGGTILGTAANSFVLLGIGKGAEIIHGDSNTYIVMVGG